MPQRPQHSPQHRRRIDRAQCGCEGGESTSDTARLDELKAKFPRHEALSNEVMLLKAQLGDLNAVVEKVVNLF